MSHNDQETLLEYHYSNPASAGFSFALRHASRISGMAKEKCTKDVIRIAVKLKKHGALDKDIALACGVCPQTLSTWLHHPQTANQREFSEAVKKVEVDFKDKLTQIIMRDAQGRDWKAAAWLLERKYPNEYGRVTRVIDDSGDSEEVPRIVFDPKKGGKG